MTKPVITTTLKDIPILSKSIAQNLKGGEVFALYGDLGSGKTTFVKAVSKALGYKGRVVSPTFTIMNCFPVKIGKGTKKQVIINHLDLYRTRTWREVKALGIGEVWSKPDTVTFIEWADKIKKHLPNHTTVIAFTHD